MRGGNERVDQMAKISADVWLTIQRLFCSSEFEEIPARRLQRQHDASIFPCRARRSVEPEKMLVGICFQSHGGGADYGINVDLLTFMQKESADQKFICFVSSEDPKNQTVDYFDGQITLEEQLEKVEGVLPSPGKFGRAKFYWVDKEGTPSERHI